MLHEPVYIPFSWLCIGVQCPSVEEAQLTADVKVPPARYAGAYNETDKVNYTDVVTAVCDWPAARAPVNRTARCVFDPAADQYRLIGDSFDCAGACVSYYVFPDHIRSVWRPLV